MHPNKLATDKVLPFIIAGKAVFTARGRDNRFTFRVKTPIFNGLPNENLRFVSVLVGPDNTRSYAFFGTMVRRFGKWEFRLSPKAKVAHTALSVVAFKYIIDKLLHDQPLPASLEIWHQGKCGKCGKPLTVPESIESGIGPVCANMLN